MGILVEKYGATSVAGAQRMRAVARSIARRRDGATDLVVVVSALGETADALLHLAHEVTRRPARRELDLLLSTGEVVACALLAMSLGEQGVPAVALTAAQAGIRTDDLHGNARILRIDTQRLHHELGLGNVVVVAGFQGVRENHDITTLGRGGGDTTAVAITAALSARECHLYGDAAGVFTADPAICPRAYKLSVIAYDEMLELARHGACVMHPRSVELARERRLPVHVRSSFSEEGGTVVAGSPGGAAIRGIAHTVFGASGHAEVSVVGPGAARRRGDILEVLGRAGIAAEPRPGSALRVSARLEAAAVSQAVNLLHDELAPGDE